MRNTRIHKRKGAKKQGRRTRKGGYWFYPSDTDTESSFSKIFGVGKKNTTTTPPMSDMSISKPDVPPPTPPVEVKAVETEEVVNVPEPSESQVVAEEEKEEQEQNGGKRLRKYHKKGGVDCDTPPCISGGRRRRRKGGDLPEVSGGSRRRKRRGSRHITRRNKSYKRRSHKKARNTRKR